MTQRLITITVHREESLEERNLREAAERRATYFWYAAAAVVLILLALCRWATDQERALEARQQERITSGPVVQLIHLEKTVSTSEEDSVTAVNAEQTNELPDCVITYFCAEKYPHICGTGDGITASGAAAVPYETCAVDPAVIPLGSTVLVDFGDGVLHTYRAEDVGGAVAGNHVDLCVASHQEAEMLGVMSATVYWKEG